MGKRNLLWLAVAANLAALLGNVSVALAQGAWAPKDDMMAQREALVASMVHDKIYVMGGTSPLGRLATVEQYSPVTDTWVPKKDMPTARQGLAACVVNGLIYAIGGIGDPEGGKAGDQFLQTIEVYDPATDKWDGLEPMPTGRHSIVSGSAQGKAYVMGGGAGGGVVFAQNEEYDPEEDSWSDRAAMITPKASASAAVVDGKIYVIGGYIVGGSPSDTVEAYDAEDDSWDVTASMPDKRAVHASVAVNGKIYVFGGLDAGGVPIATGAVYDPRLASGRPSTPCQVREGHSQPTP